MEESTNTAFGLNYRSFIDTLVAVNEMSETKTNIQSFLKRNEFIEAYKMNDYQMIKDIISKTQEICDSKQALNKVCTLEGQKEILNSSTYHELISKLIECRISTDSNKKREFNIELYLDISEHFIELSEQQ